MSGRRLAATTLVMSLIAVALGALSPDGADLQTAISHPQRVSDGAGPDTVVLAWATVLAWTVWAWGVLGLALTAASALPGLLGSAARLLLRAVLPRAARRAAALALGGGLGLGVGAPALATAATPAAPWRRRPTGRRRHRLLQSPTGPPPPPVSTSSSAATGCGTSPPIGSGRTPAAHRPTGRSPPPSGPGGP